MRRVALVLALIPLLVALAACRGEIQFDSESDLVVLNQSACELTIYVDGYEAFTVRGRDDRTLDGIGEGRHVLEALNRAGALVERRTIELRDGEDYYWRIDDC